MSKTLYLDLMLGEGSCDVVVVAVGEEKEKRHGELWCGLGTVLFSRG